MPLCDRDQQKINENNQCGEQRWLLFLSFYSYFSFFFFSLFPLHVYHFYIHKAPLRSSSSPSMILPQSMSKPSPPFHSHLLTSDPVHPGHSQWTSQPFGCVFFIWPCVSVMVTGYMRPLRSYSQTKTQSSCRTTGLRLWYNQVLFNIPARLYVVNPHDYITGKDHRRARTINHASFPPLSTCC